MWLSASQCLCFVGRFSFHTRLIRCWGQVNQGNDKGKRKGRCGLGAGRPAFKLMIGVLLFSLAMMVDLQKAELIFPFMPRALEG